MAGTITRIDLTHGPEAVQSIKDILQATNGDAGVQAGMLERFFAAVGAGVRNASFTVHIDDSGTGTEGKATVDVTFVYATVADQDTMVVGGVTLKAVTGAPALETEFRKEVDLATMIANFCVVFNAHSTLGLVMSAAVVSAGVVRITYKRPGVAGNYVQCARATGTGWTFATAALAGGATTGVRTYRRGL